MNEVAKRVTLMEGKKIQLPIGQVKEVLKCFLRYCAKNFDPVQVVGLLNRYGRE
jgi:hypothetical protein